MRFGDGATWRSGDATVCKTVYTGSIPVVASIRQHIDLISTLALMPRMLEPAVRWCFSIRFNAPSTACDVEPARKAHLVDDLIEFGFNRCRVRHHRP
jgi:hypothetical protein